MSTVHQASIVAQFTRTADAFASAPQFTDLETLNLLLKVTRATPQDDSLDVACGAGVVAVHFASVVRHATGIDLTPAMLNKARERQVKAGLINLTWDEGDVANLPYPDGKFSVVTSRFAIHHMINPESVFEEIFRVCKIGGRIAICDISLPNDPDAAAAFNRIESQNDPSHAKALMESEWQTLFNRSALSDMSITRYQLAFPLRKMLQASFVPEDQAQEIEREVRNQISEGSFQFCAALKADRCMFLYPIAVMSAMKIATDET